MNNIAHNGRNGLRCPYCREPLNDVAPAPAPPALTIAAPQLNIQFNLDPITPTSPPPLSDSDDETDVEIWTTTDDDEETDDGEGDEEEEEEIPVPVTHWETPVEQPTRVVIARFFNVDHYVDEEDYVYDINTGECIGRLYDPETVDEGLITPGMITPAAPLTNFVIVSSFDAEPTRVVMEEILGMNFYMDEDYRLYDLLTRTFVGYADMYNGTIDYLAGLSGGVQVLQDFVLVHEHVYEEGHLISDSDSDSDSDEDEYEEELDESFPMEAQEVPEVMCC